MNHLFKTAIFSLAVAVPAAVLAEDESMKQHTMPHGEVMPGVSHKSAQAKMAEPAEEAGPSWDFQGWIDQEVTFDQSQENAFYGIFEVGFRMSHEINANFGGHLQLNGRWYQDPTTGGLLGLGNGSLNLLAREAYAYWQNDSGKVRIQAGKWYVPIGWELADPPDLYQYSNSNQFNYFLPTEGLGVISYLTLSDTLDLALYVGSTDDDFMFSGGFNEPPVIGERFGVAIGDNAGAGLSLVVSGDGAGDDYDQILVDVDASAELDDLTVAGEFSLLTVFDGPIDYGVMGMASYWFTEHVGATFRADLLAGDSFADPEVGLTAAGMFNFAPGWDLFLEIREDINDADAGENNLTGALELIYQFL